jgi:hypothetical protein
MKKSPNRRSGTGHIRNLWRSVGGHPTGRTAGAGEMCPKLIQLLLLDLNHEALIQEPLLARVTGWVCTRPAELEDLR